MGVEGAAAAAVAAVATLGVAGALYQAAGVRRDRRRFRPPGGLIDVGGHRLHVTCRGEGAPPVFFEAAVGASALSWTLVQPEVAAFTRACAYDRAGLAWSEAPSRPRTFEGIVDELSRLVDHVSGGRRGVLVGHSFGAFVVQAYAARHPGRVAGLVLVDPALEWLRATREQTRLLRGGALLCRVGGVLARVGVVRACLSLLTGGVPAAPRGFVRVFGPTAAATLARIVGEVRKLPAGQHPVVQALWCRPRCFRALADHFGVIAREGPSMDRRVPPEVPVVVISSGRRSPGHLAAHAALAAASAGGRHVVAGHSDHWVPFDEPALVVAAVRDLVEAERSTARPSD